MTKDITSDEIDRIDWEILNALSDDYESIEQIQNHIMPARISQNDIVNRMQKLHENNYVYLTMNMKFDRNSMMQENNETKQRRYWFGRTEKGYLAWQRLASEHSQDNET